MATVKIDFENEIGRIKPVHSVGQPPHLGVNNYSKFFYLKEANIPYSRLHDVGWPFGSNLLVDIPNIFRDFDADVEDPNSYDFVFTDGLITALVENGVEPFYRLGVTIENFQHIKAYRIYPPKDFLKWAKICEHIIRHYTEGWANGFNYNIKYWEIWNEPEIHPEISRNLMWKGTKEQFYEFYSVAATHLKEKFPHLKIGGYGSCGFYCLADDYVAESNNTSAVETYLIFFNEFIEYIKEHNAPLDFFSWHTYDNIKNAKKYAEYARKRLDEAGYTETETTCNEWNCMPDKRGTMLHAANVTAMVLMMQDSVLDSAMFYDARIGVSVYGGLFNPMTKEPLPTYYGFKFFGQLYRMSNQVNALTDNENVYVVSAKNDDEGGILIANIGAETEFKLDINGQVAVECQKIIENGEPTVCEIPEKLPENSVYYITTKKQ